MGHCLQSARSVHMLRGAGGKVHQGSSVQGKVHQGSSVQGKVYLGSCRPWQGRSFHNRHCQSKHIRPAATYGQLGAGCMISAHAKPGTVQVAAARCGRGRPSNRRWLEHAHWPLSCRHMFKAHALCCNASSKWAVSAVIAAGWHTQLLSPTPSLPFLFISISLIPLKPLYFLPLPIFGCGLHARVI